MNMTAQDLVLSGRPLVGTRIHTEPAGEWTGGACEIIEVDPDPHAPEIVFWVRRLSDGDEIGVFEDETVTVLP